MKHVWPPVPLWLGTQFLRFWGVPLAKRGFHSVNTLGRPQDFILSLHYKHFQMEKSCKNITMSTHHLPPASVDFLPYFCFSRPLSYILGHPLASSSQWQKHPSAWHDTIITPRKLNNTSTTSNIQTILKSPQLTPKMSFMALKWFFGTRIQSKIMYFSYLLCLSS